MRDVAALQARVEAVARDARTAVTPCGSGVMRWRRWGEPGDRPPLVLLHGGSGSWTHWIANIPVLSREREVICADLPGLGDSDPAPEGYTPQSLGRIVADGLTIVLPGDRPFHLGGFSFGSNVGGQAARLMPDRIASFTMVGAPSMGLRRDPPVEPLGRFDPEAAEAITWPQQKRNLEILMFADPDRAGPFETFLQIENMCRMRTRSRRFAYQPTLREALEALPGVPLNGIWGAADITAAPYIDEREALLRELCDDLMFETVPDAGHWVMYEAASRFNAVLADMLTIREENPKR